MKNNLSILKKSPLFAEIVETDINTMLHCLNATTKSFKKNNFIFSFNDKVSTVGIILSGSVHIVKEDFWGNRSIIEQLSAGHLFAETFSCAQIKQLPVSVIAKEATEILFIDYKRIISTCSSSCIFHTKLIQNMLKIIANKNILLTQKIEHITRRTTREKIISFLSAQAKKSSSNSFTIQFNRQELADYLSVDRSAMSNELCKMRDEGLITFQKNKFELIEKFSLP